MIHLISWKICLFLRWRQLTVMRWVAAWNLPLPAISGWLQKALLGLPEIKLGLFPAGRCTEAATLDGTSLAKEMLFLGEPLTASASLAAGLVNRVVPHSELLPAAKELAHQLASRPGVAVKLVKETVNRGICSSLEEGLTVERDLLDRAFMTEDAREGVVSFLEKRKAHFKHC